MPSESEECVASAFHLMRSLGKSQKRLTNADARFQAVIEAHAEQQYLEWREVARTEWVAARDAYERTLG